VNGDWPLVGSERAGTTDHSPDNLTANQATPCWWPRGCRCGRCEGRPCH
jgi:hypothetical protein